MDIISLNQTANDNDTLAASWVNEASNKIREIEKQLASLTQQLNTLKAQLNAFHVSSSGGLQINCSGGNVKIRDEVYNIKPQVISLKPNKVNFIFITEMGILCFGDQRPEKSYDVAKVVTNQNSIVEIKNYPLHEVKPSAFELDKYATIEFARSQRWIPLVAAIKRSIYRVPERDKYFILPFEEIRGNGFDTGGTFTCRQVGQYIFHAQIRVITTRIAIPLSVKLSFFINNIEFPIPLIQVHSARGDVTLNASNAIPYNLKLDDKVHLMIYLTQGESIDVREGSGVQVYLLPSA